MIRLMSMKASLIVLVALLFSPSLLMAQSPTTQSQPISNLDELLKTVKQNRQLEAQLNKQREQKFIAEKSRQKALLAEAKKKFEASQTGNNPLKLC